MPCSFLHGKNHHNTMLSLLQYNCNIKFFTFFDSHQRSWFCYETPASGWCFKVRMADCSDLALQFVFILVLRIVDLPTVFVDRSQSKRVANSKYLFWNKVSSAFSKAISLEVVGNTSNTGPVIFPERAVERITWVVCLCCWLFIEK